jgi:excisionase family DNA binding protein
MRRWRALSYNGRTMLKNHYESGVLDEPQAADYIQVEPRTIRLWRNTKGLPHLKISARTIRYRKADLDQWLSQHRVEIVR